MLLRLAAHHGVLTVRMAVVAAISLVAGACGGGSGGSADENQAAETEESEHEHDQGEVKTGHGQPIMLASAVQTELAADGALNPTTAVDPDSGTVYVAWAREVAVPADAPVVDGKKPDPLLQAVVSTSTDGGKTFGGPVAVSPAGIKVASYTVSPTQVAVGHDGEVYVLYLENFPQELPDWTYGYSHMRIVRSDDNGKTFSAPVAVTTEASEGVVTSTEMATLFVAPDSDLYISFLDFRGDIKLALDKKAGKVTEDPHAAHGDKKPEPPTQLRIVRSGDGGRTWGKSVLVSEPTCGCCGTKVAQATGDGPLYVTTRSEWLELKDSYDAVRDPFISVSRDDGATFSKAKKIHDDQFKISGCPDVNAGLSADPDGVVHAAWYTGTETGPGVYYATSKDEGETFSKPLGLLTDEWVPYGDVKMVLDVKNRAWVVYEDRRGDEDMIQVALVAGDHHHYSKAWPGQSPDIALGNDGVMVTWGTKGTDAKSGSVRAAFVTFTDDDKDAKTDEEASGHE